MATIEENSITMREYGDRLQAMLERDADAVSEVDRSRSDIINVLLHSGDQFEIRLYLEGGSWTRPSQLPITDRSGEARRFA